MQQSIANSSMATDQSCSAARPAMKLTGKEDDELTSVVSNWWSTGLTEYQCWHIVFVPGRGKLLVRRHVAGYTDVVVPTCGAVH
jgi:hypothetical protein